MRRPALYSSSGRPTLASSAPDALVEPVPDAPAASAPAPRLPRGGQRFFTSPRAVSFWAFGLALAALITLWLPPSFGPGWRGKGQPPLTQKALDAAVLKTLETNVMPSEAGARLRQDRPVGGARARLWQIKRWQGPTWRVASAPAW